MKRVMSKPNRSIGVNGKWFPSNLNISWNETLDLNTLIKSNVSCHQTFLLYTIGFGMLTNKILLFFMTWFDSHISVCKYPFVHCLQYFNTKTLLLDILKP